MLLEYDEAGPIETKTPSDAQIIGAHNFVIPGGAPPLKQCPPERIKRAVIRRVGDVSIKTPRCSDNAMAMPVTLKFL